jgi:ATP-dependent Clp protease ATP-binding subunit ClpC
MFERYTEGARRVLFFALNEAKVLGSPYIETEHLLLGLLKEDPELVQRLVGKRVTEETFRASILANSTMPEVIATKIDPPLTNQCKRILAYANEESERLEGRRTGTVLIRTGHLLLGLMREQGCPAARLLKDAGAELAAMRTRMAAGGE